MKLDGRRGSSNIQDRRGAKRAAMGIGGIGGIVVAVVFYFVFGTPPPESLTTGGPPTTQQVAADPNYADGAFADEEALKNFVSIILASTEDVWTDIFRQNGMTYQEPQLILFRDRVKSACGTADFSVGPFYCPADQSVYIDLAFFASMHKTLGSGGDFAFAYVIAHEVGHHVQYLLGDLKKNQAKEQVFRKQGQAAKANLVSVQSELQADFYAGVWANHEGKRFNSIDESDIREGIAAASSVGDDKLGHQRPESFNHGSAEMRVKWFTKGLKSGDCKQGNTYQYTLDTL